MHDDADLIDRARAIKARHAERLMSLPGVVGVGVGLRQRSGQFTDEVAIVVMVRHKAEPGSLPPAELLPSQLEGIPVDVQETGEITAG